MSTSRRKPWTTTQTRSGKFRQAICEIAELKLDDGVVFDCDGATAVVIRDEDAYAGVRVTLSAQLATAQLRFHVDVNVGDPIVPAPQDVGLPKLLGGEVLVRGYPLVMVHAEKIVTAVTRGTVNTRWRDFADVYLLSRRHPVDGTALVEAVRRVASHRQTTLTPLAQILDGYGEIGQSRWAAWVRRQRIEARVPERFAELVLAVLQFADPAVTGSAAGRVWDPTSGTWS
jgi:hypothetical protein